MTLSYVGTQKFKLSPFALYEHAVQSPDIHVDFFSRLFREIRGREAVLLREDFCGTFRISCAWAAGSPAREAVAVDLDPAPLRHGRRVHLGALPAPAAARVRVVRGDVRTVRLPPADLVVVCNYSFWLFRSEAGLSRYLRAARRGLGPEGVLVLESLAGRPAPTRTTSFRRGGRPWFTFTWERRSWNPATRRLRAAIHFRDPEGRELRDAFTYDFRFWRAAEIERLLRAAGFGAVGIVRGKPTGASLPIFVVATV